MPKISSSPPGAGEAAHVAAADAHHYRCIRTKFLLNHALSQARARRMRSPPERPKPAAIGLHLHCFLHHCHELIDRRSVIRIARVWDNLISKLVEPLPACLRGLVSHLRALLHLLEGACLALHHLRNLSL